MVTILLYPTVVLFARKSSTPSQWLCRQLQYDLPLTMGSDLQAISGTIERIFAAYCWFKADKGCIRFSLWFRPDLHVCQGVATIARQFGNGQRSSMRHRNSYAM